MRPENILYGLDDRPPATILVLSTLQQASAAAATSFATLITVLDASGVAPDVASNAFSVGMLALAIATAFNCSRWGRVGSGYLIPGVLAPSLLPAMLVAVHVGGLGLAFGMTVVAGVVQALLAPAVPRLRPLFPTEVAGLVVFMIGLQMGLIGVGLIFGTRGPQAGGATGEDGLLLALITLAVIITCSVWIGGRVRTFSVLIGITVGYVASLALGLFDPQSAAFVGAARLVWFPQVLDRPFALSLSPDLLVLFAVGALTNCLQAIGVVTTAQKINDARWLRPELTSIEGGILATGLANILAGLLGSIGTNMASSAVGLSGVTGVTSRRVGFGVAVLFLVLSLCPVFAAVLTVMPRPVLGAVLLFGGSFVIINGMQIILSRVIDIRKTLVISIPIVLGVAFQVRPEAFTILPSFIQSSIVLSIGVALALNLLFRLGVTRVARAEIDSGAQAAQQAYVFLQRQGGAWAARQDVMQRAIRAVCEFAEVSPMVMAPGTRFSVTATFDEFRIEIEIAYRGQPFELSGIPPTEEEMLEDDNALIRLAAVLLVRSADRVTTRSDDLQRIQLTFDH